MKKNHIRLAIATLLFALFACAVLACTYATGNPATEPHKLGSLSIDTLNGDLDGSTAIQKIVTGIEGHGIAPPPAGEGGVAIEWDGAALYWGTAGGSIAPGAAGQVLATNDAGAATTWVYPHGDVDASATDPGAITVNAIQSVGVSSSTPSSTNVLAYSSGLWRPTALSTSNITSGTAGQVMVTNSSPASAWTSLISYETTHGRFTSGGSGSDFSAAMGPIPGDETLGAGLWALPNATAASASNYVFQSDGTNAYYNTIGGSGFHQWRQANGGAIAQLTSSLLYLGGNTTAAPIGLIYSTATTPIIQAGTSATSLALGTNKTGATLALNVDAAANLFQLAGGTQDGFALGMHLAASGHIRTPSAWEWHSRNAANSADLNLISVDGSDAIKIGTTANGGVTVGPDTNGGSANLLGNPVNISSYAGGGTIYLRGYTFALGGFMQIAEISDTHDLTFTPGATYTISNTGADITTLQITTSKSGAALQLGGDVTANVAKLTTAFEHQTYADFDSVATPGTPLSTQRRVYVDASDRLVVEDNLGNITVLAP